MLRSCRAPQSHSNPCYFCLIAYLTYYPCGWNCILELQPPLLLPILPQLWKKGWLHMICTDGINENSGCSHNISAFTPQNTPFFLLPCCFPERFYTVLQWTSYWAYIHLDSVVNQEPTCSCRLMWKGSEWAANSRILRQTWRPYVWLLCCNLFLETHSGCISMFLRVLSSLSHHLQQGCISACLTHTATMVTACTAYSTLLIESPLLQLIIHMCPPK